MKIVHISLACPFTEGWEYHENLLPKWHKLLGNDVVIVARDKKYDKGKVVPCKKETKMISDGVKLYRLKVSNPAINSWCKPNKKEVIQILVNEKPDLIWVHGIMSINLKIAVSYKLKFNPEVTIVADNHTDWDNYKSDFLRRINLRLIANRTKKISKYVKHFYGVTPGRVTFMIDYLSAPKEKSLLTIQGGDPQIINFEKNIVIRQKEREKNNIKQNDFVFITGGKLDQNKEIIPLIKHFQNFKNEKSKLLIFGSVDDSIKNSFFSDISKDKRIIYLGFLSSVEISNAFLASDIALFPGGHSVLWEKALACGLPCVFGKKSGFEHLFIGGAKYVENVSTIDFDEFLDTQVYDLMKSKAVETRKEFLYDAIAQKTLDDNFE